MLRRVISKPHRAAEFDHKRTFTSMTNSRTELEAAAGKLISAIQKEWHSEAGAPESAASEAVMHSAHELLQASKSGSLATVIGSGSVSSYLGNRWVQEHPRVVPYIAALEAAC
ncbi:hypothetical protein ACTJKQ_16100 [Acidovorax sp. 22279]|uniref:hypothetical protein n=1 Tax=Acidovorax sp. 22279 TaxID=3453900 RepID=UPI003F8574FB